MADVDELLRAGALDNAIASTTERLRATPGDQRARVTLFELLCYAGAYDRALKQVDILSAQASDAGTEFALQMYRSLVVAEQKRAAVFRGEAAPKFLLTPPPHVEPYVTLVAQAARGGADLEALVGQAEEATPPVAGRLDDRPFADVRDADDRLAPVVEVFHGGEYVWLPLSQIVRIDIQPPKRLREVLWLPARVQAVGEPAGDVFLPGLYPSSAASTDPDVRLGRTTDWQSLHEAVVVGAGAHVLLVDGEPVSLSEARVIEFAHQGAAV